MSGKPTPTAENLKAEIAHLQGQIAVLTSMFESERAKCDDLRLQVERLKMDGSGSSESQPMSATLVRSFSEMTIKQRAVVFATLLGAGYADIADAMGVDQTTVKLHLKAALGKLGASSRENLRAHSKSLLDALGKLDTATMFGLPVDWMEKQEDGYMQLLRPVRSGTPPAGGKPNGPARKAPARTK